MRGLGLSIWSNQQNILRIQRMTLGHENVRSLWQIFQRCHANKNKSHAIVFYTTFDTKQMISCRFSKSTEKLKENICVLSFKVGLSYSKFIYFLQLNGFKNYEKSFLFYVKKLFSFSRYLNLYLNFLVIYKKTQLDWKHKVNFKIYDVTTCLKAIATHILLNISQSKSNQTKGTSCH